jgi:hypothetical protein
MDGPDGCRRRRVHLRLCVLRPTQRAACARNRRSDRHATGNSTYALGHRPFERLLGGRRSDAERSAAPSVRVPMWCAVRCGAHSGVTVSIPKGRPEQPILSALPTVSKEDRIGQSQAAIAASLRSAVWRYHAVRRSAAVLLTAPVRCACAESALCCGDSFGGLRCAVLNGGAY